MTQNIKHFTICRGTNAYPVLLNMIENPPETLYGWGNQELLYGPIVAIVGTRNPTPAASDLAFRMGKLFAQNGITVLSGLALGCDTQAHEGALSVHGPTIAVLSTPLLIGHIYPWQNKGLAQDILKQDGLLLSQYNQPSQVDFKARLVARDAVQAALAYFVIPIQFKVDSGTRHAVNAAIEYNRPVVFVKPDHTDRRDNWRQYSGNEYYQNKLGQMSVDDEILYEIIRKLKK